MTEYEIEKVNNKDHAATPRWVYIYCTKGKPYLRLDSHSGIYYADETISTDGDLNGKIVAHFELNRIEIIDKERFDSLKWKNQGDFDLQNKIALKATGMSLLKIAAYANGKDLVYWHIDNLKILDNPIQLGDFTRTKKECQNSLGCLFEKNSINKAPQSWGYAYNQQGNRCVIVSIRPKWVAKILNREKTVEIRKTSPKWLK